MKTKLKLKKKFVVFLCLYGLFFVMYFSVVSFAKYTSSVNKSGSIGVAKWDVSVAGSDSQTLPQITIGDASTYQTYNLTVTSLSEVGLTYSLVLSNVPDDVVITIGGVNYTPTNGNITVPNLGSIDAGDTTNKVHAMIFSVPIDSDQITSKTMDIDVVFTQVPVL